MKIVDNDIPLIQLILILIAKDFIWYDQVLKNAYAYAKHHQFLRNHMFQMNFELIENEKNEYVEEEKIWLMKMKICI